MGLNQIAACSLINSHLKEINMTGLCAFPNWVKSTGMCALPKPVKNIELCALPKSVKNTELCTLPKPVKNTELCALPNPVRNTRSCPLPESVQQECTHLEKDEITISYGQRIESHQRIWLRYLIY